MKTPLIFSLAAVIAAGSVLADPAKKIGPDGKPMAPPPGPPLTVIPPAGSTTTVTTQQTYVYEQKPISGQPVLVTPEQARAIIDAFKQGYAKLGEPRIMIYVNRDLVDEKSGISLSARSEKTTSSRSTYTSDFKADPNANVNGKGSTISAGGNLSINGNVSSGTGQLPVGQGTISASNEQTTRDNTYRQKDRADQSLADRQTVRDVERLFGRPLRHGGAKITDQRVATQLMANRPLEQILNASNGEQARKDREAISQYADVVLEVLISSRNVVVPEVSGDKVYTAPDIQATAIRVKDSQIIAQASASDILGKDRYAGRVLRNFDVREIAEATALALMEDMMLSVKAD